MLAILEYLFDCNKRKKYMPGFFKGDLLKKSFLSSSSSVLQAGKKTFTFLRTEGTFLPEVYRRPHWVQNFFEVMFEFLFHF